MHMWQKRSPNDHSVVRSHLHKSSFKHLSLSLLESMAQKTSYENAEGNPARWDDDRVITMAQCMQ